MNHEIAQLRHFYANMVNGCVKDSAAAKRIAEGLLAPVIEEMERVVTQQKDAQVAMEQVLVDGVAYQTPAPVAGELLRLHLELSAHQQEALQADAEQDPIRALITQHAEIIAQNESAYFELAYHKSAGWMAWITDKPLCMPPVINPDRNVLACGQGETADEACLDAAQKGGA